MAPPSGDEAEILAVFGDEAGVRLCCQLELVTPTDKVVLEVVTD
jgi:ferredoxin